MNIDHKGNLKRLDKIVELRSQGVSFKEIAKQTRIADYREAYSAYVRYCSKYNIQIFNPTLGLDENSRNQFIKNNPINHKILSFEKRKLLGMPVLKYSKSLNNGINWIREIVRARDNYTCKICGKKWLESMRRFDVHHMAEDMLGKNRMKGVIEYDKNNMDKLITYCHKCHMGWHNKMGHLGKKIRY